MTVLSPDEVRFRDDLARALNASIPVDVDAEWEQLQRSIRPVVVPARPSRLPWLVAVAALVVAILALARPVALEVRIANAVRDLVGIEQPVLPTTPPPAPTTTAAPPTTQPAPTTTTEIPPPPETTTTLPDVSHKPILDDDAYRETLREVHIQLNNAVGWEQTNLDALEGSAELLEGLRGQDPELDGLLGMAIQLVRWAHEDGDRDAAVSAHRLVAEMENRRAAR